jgi:hypothetical protein
MHQVVLQYAAVSWGTAVALTHVLFVLLICALSVCCVQGGHMAVLQWLFTQEECPWPTAPAGTLNTTVHTAMC